MAHRALSVCLILFLSNQLLFAQQEDESWLSLKRFTLSASGSYTYAPWTKYNESVQKVQEAIRFNPWYPNPQGSLDLIHGDFDSQLEAQYRFWGPLFFLINVGWLHTEGVIDYSRPSAYSTSYWQAMWLSSYHYGAGIGYGYALSEKFSCQAAVLVMRFPAHLDFGAAYNATGYSYLFAANLRQPALGAILRIETEYHFTDHLNLTASVGYRWLRFKEFRGEGSETDIENYPSTGIQVSDPQPFGAALGEADDYFGLYVTDHQGYVSDHILHLLWDHASSGQWWNTQRVTSLDLSGFGFGLGVSYAF